MLIALALLLPASPQVSTVPIAPSGTTSFTAFGFAVDISGDTAVVGADYGSLAQSNDGSVRFYERDPVTDAWDLTQHVLGDPQDRLGFSVAIDGDVAVLGHQSARERPVRVMERSAGGWIETARLDYSGNPGVTGPTGFGYEVDVSQGVIAVGARGARDGGGGVTGAVYLFEKQQGQWVQSQRLLPPQNPTTGQFPLNNGFGRRVAVDGNSLAVGAWMAPSGGSAQAGRVHVYASSGGAFSLQRTIPSPGMPGSFRFGGYGFDLQGDTLAVAAIGTHVGNTDSSGMVHLYDRASGAWNEVAQLVDPSPSLHGYFGEGLSLDGDRIVIGRSSYFRRTQAQRRLSLVSFTRAASSGAWDVERELFDPLEAGDTCFGVRVALDGSRVLAGAPCAVVDGNPVGAVYVLDVEQDTEPFATVACGGGPCRCAPFEPWLGCGNSTRGFAELSAFGTASLGRDDLTLSVRDAVPNVVARVALGPGFAEPRPLGDGMVCIQTPGQLAPRMTGADGTLAIPGGIVQRAADQLGAAGVILPGETWFFQVIYDEPRRLFPCNTHDQFTFLPNLQKGLPHLLERGFNLTNGLSVTWRP
jgi:hypothetical protein